MIPAGSLEDFQRETTPIYGQAADAVTVDLVMTALIEEDDAAGIASWVDGRRVASRRILRPVTDGCAECFDAGYVCTPDDGCVTRCPGGICDECDEAAEL